MDTHTTTATAAFGGTIPESYDRDLGPFLFQDYAADLAARLRVPPGGHVLETACGTGIASEHLRRALDERVSITASDLSPAMLDVARRRRGHLSGLRFDVADAAALPYVSEGFDAVCMQFGIMFVPDKAAAMAEARRVLRRGGQLALSVWGEPASNPYVGLAQGVIAAFFDADPPGFLDVPWSFHERGPIERLLREAGLVDVAFDDVAHVCERPAAREVARGLVCGNPTLVDVEARARAPVDVVVDAVAHALGEAFGHAPLRAPMQALVVTARRP